jgi:hypothetical protein
MPKVNSAGTPVLLSIRRTRGSARSVTHSDRSSKLKPLTSTTGMGIDCSTVLLTGSTRLKARGFSPTIQNDPSLKKAMFRGDTIGVVDLSSPVVGS